ncbi:hypothetical protein QOT17_002024 [Balamuthia mandrillaris]
MTHSNLLHITESLLYSSHSSTPLYSVLLGLLLKVTSLFVAFLALVSSPSLLRTYLRHAVDSATVISTWLYPPRRKTVRQALVTLMLTKTVPKLPACSRGKPSSLVIAQAALSWDSSGEEEDKKRFDDICYQKSELMEMINQLTTICKEENEPLFHRHSNLPSQLPVNTPSTPYVSPKGTTSAGAATPKVVKPLPAVFSLKHFSLRSATETSKAGSSSESGYAEPSDKTGSKEKYPKLPQNLPTFDPKTKGKDNPLIFLECLHFALSGTSYPENLWHYALISQIKDPLAQHWAIQNLRHPEWPWDRLIATFHDHFGSRNLQNALHTEFCHFFFKTGESVREFSECFQELIDQMTCPPQLEDILAVLRNALPEELVSGFISSCIANPLTSLVDAIGIALEHESALEARSKRKP